MMHENDFIALARSRAGEIKRREKRRRTALLGTALPVTAALCLALFWPRPHTVVPIEQNDAQIVDHGTQGQEEQDSSRPERPAEPAAQPLALTLRYAPENASSLSSSAPLSEEITFEGEKAREALALLRSLTEKYEPQESREDSACPFDAVFEFSSGETFLLRPEKRELVSDGLRYTLGEEDLAALNALFGEDRKE